MNHPLSVTLLYRDLPLAAGDAVARGLEARGFAAEGPVRADGTQRWQGDGLVLTLCQMRGALAASDFVGALGTAYDGANGGQIASIIERHGGRLTLTLDPVCGSDARLDAMRLLHALCGLAARASAPMALMWGASGQILTGAQYGALIDVATPWALFLHPVAQAAGRDGEGRALTRLRLDHAEDFVGRPVMMAPAPLSRAEVLRLGLGFVAHCVETGRIPAPGAIVGLAGAARVEVAGDAAGPAIVLIAHAPHAMPRAPSLLGMRAGSDRWRTLMTAGSAAALTAAVLALAPMLNGPRTTSLATAEITVAKLP